MRRIRSFVRKLGAVLRRPQVDREMEAELAGHLEAEIEELIARGQGPAEARSEALATMGRTEVIRQECRDSRGTLAWDNLWQDIAFGVRMVGRNPVFSLMALATITLGIGSTSAVFSLIDGILVRALPFAAPERLYFADGPGMRGPFDTLRAGSRLAEYAAYGGMRSFNAQGREWPERLKGSEVSANFFEVLGVAPRLGRTFAEGEDRSGKLRVVVLSHEFWVQHYGARPDIAGQQLALDGLNYEIIGVVGADMRFPNAAADFWAPMRADPRIAGEYWGAGGVSVFARLRPGVSAATAEAELRAWIPRIRAMFPWRMPDAWGSSANLTPLQEHLVAGAKVRSLTLFAVVAFVLLIAVVNVANLLMAQAAARQREFALRMSLGATPGRLVRQLLTEALLLAAAGGVLGAALAFGQLAFLKHFLPADTPRLAEVGIDGRILAFTAVISLGSGVLFGLWPAWRARRQEGLSCLEGGRSTAGRQGMRADATLVMTEAAFATVLLVGAGLMLRSLWTVLQVDPGFRVESVVTAELSPNRQAKASLSKTIGVFEQVRGALAAYPGVRNVAAMNVLPLTPETSAFTAAIEDHPRPPQDPQIPLWGTVVTPDVLDTLGIRLLRGRGFTEADRNGAPLVVLITKSTAERYWPGRDPIGRRLRSFSDNEWRSVVGVVNDVRNFGIAGPPGWVEGEVYLPLGQALGVPQTLAVVARVDGESSNLEKHLPRLVKEACAECAVSKIARMEKVVAGAVRAPRSTAWLVSGFALLALIMVAAGIYGVVSHGVARRTRELGVRLALGASRGHIAWRILQSSLLYTTVGTMAGLVVSWVLARWVRSLLFGVAAHDLASFSVAPLVIVLVAGLASVIPMVRAMRIDPAQSLREG